MRTVIRALAFGALLAAVSVAAPRGAGAQSRASRLIETARRQMDDFQYDSATTTLQQALAPAAGASAGERQRGLILFGIVALQRSNGADRAGARNAFIQVLRDDASFQLPDSLADLQSDVRFAFAEARQVVPLPAAAAPSGLEVALDLPTDTVIAADSGRLRFRTTPTRASRVVAVVSPADVPAQVLWTDTQLVRGVGGRTWNLRGPDGNLLPRGRYSIRVTAIDSLRQVSPTVERVISVDRMPADTQPLPPALAASAFQPESLATKHGSPAGLAIGLGIGVAAAMLPSALGNAQLNSGQPGDGTAYAVAGVASLAGIVGFLRGHQLRFSPENAAHNTQVRQADAAQRAELSRRNRAAVQAAPVRVRVE